MARTIIIGNWKMNKDSSETASFLRALKKSKKNDVLVAVAPPFTSIHAAASILEGTTIRVAAQNVSSESSGAFTGEVSALMLKEAGCKMVIIGHSERRELFGETDESVNKKIKQAFAHGLEVIFCIGEKLEEREQGRAFEVVQRQLKSGLNGLTVPELSKLLVAYEPVWAIGTGKTATPKQAEEVHAYIRKELREAFGPQVSQAIPILYGGSVKPENSADICSQANIDGALVGGASLEPDSFIKIIDLCSRA